MKQINKLLNPAETALRTTAILSPDNKVKDVFKGYVAGFGPAVINSGVIPAIAFYLEDKEKAKVIEAIAKTLDPNNTGTKLFKSCLAQESNNAALSLLKEKIVNASIALKIMMRTYEFVTDKTN